MANFKKEFYEKLVNLYDSERKNYLKSINITDDEIMKNPRGDEYFLFENQIVYMPDEFKSPTKYLRYLQNKV